MQLLNFEEMAGVADAGQSSRSKRCGAWRRRVSLESLKGTWVALGSARALMHMPSVVSDRLMLTASLARRPAQRQVWVGTPPAVHSHMYNTRSVDR